MDINQIATLPDSKGPRFIRTVKPDGERCCGKPKPEELKPHVISSARLARIIPAGMYLRCDEESRKVKGGYYAGALELFKKACGGEKLSTFYADYELHPDDISKAELFITT